jgi:hypothetical protein
MADESVVHSAIIAGPATHVIAIGVGAYAHLANGSGVESPHGEGMGQLTSAPLSVKAFADWVIGNFDDSRPLASVRLLASGLPNDEYTNPRMGAKHAVRRATLDNVKQAVREWKAAGNTLEDNLLIFYFVGHGIASGALQSLLLEDFGATDDAPLESAIDFRGLYNGMQRCAARNQLYFIDACRAIPAKLLEGGQAGDAIIQSGIAGFASKNPRIAPIFFATLLGQDAYGRPGETSVFTDALLRSFDGAGADDSEGPWRLRTTMLLAALDFFMRRAVEQYEVLQIPTSQDTTSLFFHTLPGPARVPVLLRCSPEAAHAHAVFNIVPQGGAPEVRQGGPLDIKLPSGNYRFDCRFPAPPAGAAYVDKSLDQHVHPPYFNPPPLKVTP